MTIAVLGTTLKRHHRTVAPQDTPWQLGPEAWPRRNGPRDTRQRVKILCICVESFWLVLPHIVVESTAVDIYTGHVDRIRNFVSDSLSKSVDGIAFAATISNATRHLSGLSAWPFADTWRPVGWQDLLAMVGPQSPCPTRHSVLNSSAHSLWKNSRVLEVALTRD